ncbi:MAG: GntR family transcriptional regulator [Candidatus Tectomicrobia bacterium]|nr:GntR family transcriptional regulator [Candidatus Tectomicrobia bacterium]
MARPKTDRSSRGAERPSCSRVETAYQQLKHDILEGICTPRQRLVETDIAAQLNVSRATLRVVLTRLQHEGLVEIQPNRGAQVRALSVEEAAEILQARGVLEGLAASLAAEQATSAQLLALRDLVTEMEQTLSAGDLIGLLPLASRFHQMVIEAAHQSVVARLLDMLHAPLIRHQFRIILVPGRKEASLAEFRDILRCLEKRDATGAERAMRHHMEQLSQSLQPASRLPIS